MRDDFSRGVVLVIDDEPRNIEILAEILENECEVVFATSGRQALEVIAAGKPDLILLDVMMPEMDGYAVCVALKQAPSTADIPIIFVTGMNDVEAETRGLELGAVDYITKPISPAIVRVRVRNQIELKRARDTLRRVASIDGLTGLSNRRGFDDTLNLEFQGLAHSGGWLSLIMLDVDHFKSFNDHYGHVAGDACLRRVAAAIARVVSRITDLPARYGGEEFAVILPDTDFAEATQIATRLRDAVEELGIRHAHSPTADHVTVSVGNATGRCLDGRSSDLLATADEQLYAAKRGGRNQVSTICLERPAENTWGDEASA